MAAMWCMLSPMPLTTGILLALCTGDVAGLCLWLWGRAVRANRRADAAKFQVDGLTRQIGDLETDKTALRRQIVQLETDKAALSRQVAGEAQVKLEKSQWDEYQKFIPQMQELSKLLDRNFRAEITAARLQVPPVAVLDVARGLLGELLTRRDKAAHESIRQTHHRGPA